MGGKKKYIEKIYRDVRFFHGTFQLVPMPMPHSKYPRWQWQTSKRSMTWNERTDCNFCNHKIMFRKHGHSSNNKRRNVKGKKDGYHLPHGNRLSLRFNGHFPDGSGLAGTRMSPFWIFLELRMMELVTIEAIRHKKPQSNRHHQQTNIQLFYRSDALPVAQPPVSKHWRERTSVTAVSLKSDLQLI